MSEVEVQTAPGKVNVEESGFFFFGVPKWGKTELSAGWPNTIHLVTSLKEIQKLTVPYILVNSWKRFARAVDELVSQDKELRKKYKQYKTVVLDVVDTIYENCEEFEAKELGVKNIKDAGYGRGESRTDAEFRKYFRKLVGSRYGLVLISHWEIREVETQHGTVKKNVSTLPPRVRKIILRDINVIGFCSFETMKVIDEETGKKTTIEQRVIRFKPSLRYETGDRDGYLPHKLVIKHKKKQYHKTYKKIVEYYDGTRIAEGG